MTTKTIKLAGLYFAVVFTAGFILGFIRTLTLTPYLGRRYAELIEMPAMLGVIYFASIWIRDKAGGKQTVQIGFLALALLLTFEVSLATILFRKTALEALFDKDPVSGGAYYFSLLLFAFLPTLVRGSTGASSSKSS